MKPGSGIITLTTDFGWKDYYVSAMKAVILDICPYVRLVDVSHDIDPQDIMAGAWVLRNVAMLYPPGTVHVAVVDPGVGGDRKPVLVEIKGRFFVGPDNGLFSLVAEDESYSIVELTNTRYWRHPVSRTFHGRDVFAPVAAHVCMGVSMTSFGSVCESLTRYRWASPIADDEGIQGWIMHIDRYGNLISNIPADMLAHYREQTSFKIYVGNTVLKEISGHFSEVPDGEPVALAGSSGMLEIAINKGNAEKMLGIEKGAPVSLVVQKP